MLKPLSLAVAVTAASLALTASPALAAHHILGPTPIGEPCAAQPCTGAHLQDPSAVAVNEATDNVYVADTGNNRVEHFDLTATPA